MMPALWAYAQLHVISVNTTMLSPWDFLTAGTRFNDRGSSGWVSGGTQSSATAVTLKELIAGVQTTSMTQSGYEGLGATKNSIGQMGINLQSNFLPLIFSMVGIRVAKKLITKLGVTRNFNKLSDAVGMGSVIRA